MKRDIQHIRRENLRNLADSQGGMAALAKKLGKSIAYLSQMIGKTVRRPVGERIAREIEIKLKLHHGWLDTEKGRILVNQQLLMESVQIIERALAVSNVNLPPDKRAKLYVAVYTRLQNGPVTASEALELINLAA